MGIWRRRDDCRERWNAIMCRMEIAQVCGILGTSGTLETSEISKTSEKGTITFPQYCVLCYLDLVRMVNVDDL